MELISLILMVSIILILFVGGYYLSKNHLSKCDLIIKKLNEPINSDQIGNLNTNLNLLVKQLESSAIGTEKYWDDSSKSIDVNHIRKLNNNLSLLSKKLDNSTIETVTDWNDAIKNEKNDEKKLELLETAAKRFPSEKILVEKIRDILEPLATEGDNLLIRREALMRLREHTNLFINNCSVKDFDFALKFKNQVISSMEAIVKKIDELRETNFDTVLKELENKISQLKKRVDDEKLLEEIEKIDGRLDQNLLVNYPTLQAKYERLSKALIQILNINEKESKAELKFYNEKVLKVVKEAQALIQKHSSGIFFKSSDAVNYNEPINLSKIVKLIAGHNVNKLHPSTINYLRLVESEIFNKLSSEGKILFTELMIERAYQ